MYNLVIADDEYIIRESLAGFVNWNELGFDVVLVAKDGDEVIDLLKKRNDINVVLSDIEMKEVSGLEVAKYVSDNFLNVQVVIISGYREFEYARRAMSYNVNHYLLKPIDIGGITSTFVKVKAELDENKIKKQAEIQQKSELAQFKRAACENFFELAYLGLFAKEKDIFFHLNKFVLYDDLINMHFYELSLSLDELSDYDILAKDIIHNIFSMQALKYNLLYLPIILGKSDTSYDIIHFSPKGSCDTIIKEFYSEIQKAIWDICQVKVIIEVKIEKSDLCPFVMNLNKGSLRADSGNKEYLVSTAKQYLLILNMTSEIEETSKLLNGIFNQISGSLNDEQKREYMNKLFDKMEELVVTQMSPSNTISSFIKEPIEGISLDDYFESQIKMIYKFLEKDNIHCASTTDSVKTTIAKRITENISLQQAADEVFISPNYLSRLFKEQTGENFSDYTIKIKMEKAAEMLRKSNMKVYEISDYLGYKSLQYFYKLFKRVYFCTPSEYREQLLERD